MLSILISILKKPKQRTSPEKFSVKELLSESNSFCDFSSEFVRQILVAFENDGINLPGGLRSDSINNLPAFFLIQTLS